MSFPNGWPEPTFMHIDDDGDLSIEWIDDVERIAFFWSWADGAMAIRTPNVGAQEEALPQYTGEELSKWLTAAGARLANPRSKP